MNQTSPESASAQIEEAMWMLQDVPGDTLIERIARLSKWYQELGAAFRALADTSTDRFGTPNAITTASLEAAERGEGEVVAVTSPEGNSK